MEVLEYVKDRVRQDYPEQAESIITHTDTHLEDLLQNNETDRSEIINDGFQNLLEAALYPLLACRKAMHDLGFSKEEANEYCLKIWAEFPDEQKRKLMRLENDQFE